MGFAGTAAGHGDQPGRCGMHESESGLPSRAQGLGCAHTFRQVLYGVGSGVSKRNCKEAKTCAYAHFSNAYLCTTKAFVEWKKSDTCVFPFAGLCGLFPTDCQSIGLFRFNMAANSPLVRLLGKWELCRRNLCKCPNHQSDAISFHHLISPPGPDTPCETLHRQGYDRNETGRTTCTSKGSTHLQIASGSRSDEAKALRALNYAVSPSLESRFSVLPLIWIRASVRNAYRECPLRHKLWISIPVCGILPLDGACYRRSPLCGLPLSPSTKEDHRSSLKQHRPSPVVSIWRRYQSIGFS